MDCALYLTAALTLTLDQLSKLWVRANLAVDEILFVRGIVRIVRTPPNTGAAFGLFKDYSGILTAIAGISAILLLASPFLLKRRILLFDTAVGKFALGLVLGGTLGNLIDRLQPALGGVTDFISIGFWPTFNIADSAIVVGIIILTFTLFRLTQQEKL